MNKIILSILISFNLYSSDLTDHIFTNHIIKIVANSDNLLELNNNISSLRLSSKDLKELVDSNAANIITTYLQKKIKKTNDSNFYRNIIIDAQNKGNLYYKYLRPLISTAAYFNFYEILNLLESCGLYTKGDPQVTKWDAKEEITKPVNVILNANIYRTCMYQAFLSNNQVLINALITLLIGMNNIDVKDEKGYSHLTWAINRDHTNIAKLLIDNGANVDIAAISQAIIFKRIEILEYIIKIKTNLNIKDQNGNTPLIIATQNNNANIIKLLIDSGVNINEKNNSGKDALSIAFEKIYIDSINLLINSGADVNEANINIVSDRGLTPLMMASKYGYILIAELLINKGADIHAKDEFGNTALLLSLQNKHKDILKLLINSNANITLQDKLGYDISGSLIRDAVREKDYELIKLFISKNFNINSRDADGKTPLIIASELGYIDMVEFLLANGADINFTDHAGKTAIIFVSIIHHPDTFKLLINRGAHIDFSTRYIYKQQYSWLVDAIEINNSEIIIMLLDRGCNPNFKNEVGETALIKAAELGHVGIVEMLLNTGVDVNLKNNAGESAITIADKKGHSDIVQLLLNAGANLAIKDKVLTEEMIEENILIMQASEAERKSNQQAHVLVSELIDDDYLYYQSDEEDCGLFSGSEEENLEDNEED